jgi:hypothetical protein
VCQTDLIAVGKSGYFTVCFHLELIPVMFVEQKCQLDEWSFGWDCEQHLVQAVSLSCEKPHTHYTTNMRGPTYDKILLNVAKGLS